MMGTTEKCADCRKAKQKCLPQGRIWEKDNNDNEKCIKCKNGNRPCGPNQSLVKRTPRRRTPRLQEDRLPQSTYREMASRGVGRVSSSFCVTGAETSHNSEELRERLQDLDAIEALASEIQGDIGTMETPMLGYDVRNRPEHKALLETRHIILQDLLSRLQVVEELANQAFAAGEIWQAEITYKRVLETYQRHFSSVSSFIRPLLMKLAEFYSMTEQPLRAVNYWWEVFKLPDSTGISHYDEGKVWERLAKSLPKTTGIISETFRAHHPDLFSTLNFETPPLKIETPFPPLHAMIKNARPANLCHDKVVHESCSPEKLSTSVQSAKAGGTQNLAEIIQQIPEIDLRTKDMLGRTPLFLAAFHKKEDVGYALMMRIEKASLVHEMNARDISGQTILGIAVLSRCSFNFIKTLIEYGATVDPESVFQEPPTPLQAACMTSNAEVVRLLLERRADINRVYPGNPTPANIANHLGNDDIMHLIAGQTKSAHSPTATMSSQQPKQDDNMTNIIGQNSLPRIHPEKINLFMDDDREFIATETFRALLFPGYEAGIPNERDVDGPVY